MAYGKYYNPLILARLESCFESGDWDGLAVYLDGLSHREFRMAGEIISMQIMPRVSDTVFWEAFRFLLVRNSKAFLVTLLKSVPLRKQKSGFTLRQDGYVPVAKFLNDAGTELDRAKFIRFMVEVFGEDTEELSYLFGSLHVDTSHERVQYLLQGRGMACYYLLFQCMRQLEHERDLLVRCCQFLMKKGDALSFNLASVAKLYFDLTPVKGTFSLHLAPYQLGCLDASFESFCRVIKSIS